MTKKTEYQTITMKVPKGVFVTSVTLSQEDDSCGSAGERQSMAIEVADAGAGHFSVVRTKAWSMESGHGACIGDIAATMCKLADMASGCGEDVRTPEARLATDRDNAECLALNGRSITIVKPVVDRFEPILAAPVTVKDIVEAIRTEHRIDVPEWAVEMDKPFTTLGTPDVTIRYSATASAVIKVWIVSE